MTDKIMLTVKRGRYVNHIKWEDYYFSMNFSDKGWRVDAFKNNIHQVASIPSVPTLEERCEGICNYLKKQTGNDFDYCFKWSIKESLHKLRETRDQLNDYNESVKAEKQCTCTSQQIFRGGCVCGAIVPYKSY